MPHIGPWAFDDIRFLGSLIEKRDYQPVAGMVAEGRGGVCLLLSRKLLFMRTEHIRSRILVAEIMVKLHFKPTVVAAHFSDQANALLAHLEMLTKQSASFTSHVITLYDHNSLLFPHVATHCPPCQQSSAVLKAKDVEWRCLQSTTLSDLWNHIHRHDAQDSDWQAP